MARETPPSTLLTESMPVEGVRPSADAVNPATLVVRNALIYTADAARPSASAVAIRDGVFVAVGDDATVAPHIGPATRVVDAVGRRVIPGLNDSHLHVIRGGRNYLLELRWDGVPSLAVGLAMLADQAQRTPPGQWIRVVGGWSYDQMAEQRLPTVSELNAVSPDLPVFVLHLYQAVVLNRAAVVAIGLTKDSPDPLGGQIVRDHAGNPTGLLLAAPAAIILYAALAKGAVLSADDQMVSTQHFLRELNRFGLTSAMDAAGGYQSFPEDYKAVVELARRGELSLRIAYYLFPQIPGQELTDLRRFTEVTRPGDGDEWLRCAGAGETLVSSALDYENFAEPRPILGEQATKELDAAVRLLLDQGWGFRLHATYGETIDADLSVFEKVAADSGWPAGTRWFFDHAETVTQASLERVAALGGGVSVQNRMMFQGRQFLDRYGPEAAASAPPLRAMLDTGLTVAAGTDATRVSSYNPWLSLAWLVTGRTLSGLPLHSEANRMDRATALALYTRGGAELTGEGDQKGVIRVGMYGDLAVLSADYFAVADVDIDRIESVLTVVGGKVVYGAGEYEGLEGAPLPPASPTWSPVARFGGYQATSGGHLSSGVRQGLLVTDASAISADQQSWRQRRGDLPGGGVPDLRLRPLDPLLGCL
jgi:predicted amidohydrolase YtcJ